MYVKKCTSMRDVKPGDILLGNDGHYYMKMDSVLVDDLFTDLTKAHMIVYIGDFKDVVECYENPFASAHN